MADIKYTKDHEWIRLDQDPQSGPSKGSVGITHYAQEPLGDIVFVELPPVGTVMSKGDEIAVIESVKAASELYSPVSGEVVEVNNKLIEEPGLINLDSTGEGWFLKIKLSVLSELGELLDEPAYQALISDLD